MNDYEQFLARWNERNERLRKANEVSREAIMDALVRLGIERIEVSFDGCSDSGQIEDFVITGGSQELTGEVTVVSAPWTGANEPRTCKLDDAVEDLCYALLEQEHAGWENDDGAHGTFVFDVATRTVTLECHVRYTAYNTSEYSFGEA
ncbi:MAG: DUF6878 family protein [Variibacter sp.]